ncbi:MAG: hypothetical protein AB1521_06805 [Bacteroidota bacterium]
MNNSTLFKKISNKSSNKELIAKQIINNPDLLPQIFEGIKNNKADIKYGCDKVLRIISEKMPLLLYPNIGYFISNLSSDNNLFKWSAVVIISNLSSVDTRNKIDKIIDKYLLPIQGSVLITAANVIKGAAKIAVSKPALADKISKALLGVAKSNYQTKECNNIAIGKTIETFEILYDLVDDKDSLIKFAEGQLNNSRNATKKKAIKFLKKMKEAVN